MLDSMGKREFLAGAILLLALGLVALASYVPLQSLWGINLLQFVSSTIQVPFWTLVAIAVSCLILPARFGSVLTDSALERVLFGARVWPRVILSVACVGLFFALRGETHFLGDGYIMLSVFGHGPQTVQKWTEPGAIAIIHNLQSLLGGYTQETALTAFRILSYFSGAVCIFNYLSIARTISAESSWQMIVLATLGLSGVAVMFFGYVEHYPLIWAVLTTFVALVLRYFKGSGTVVMPILVFVLACLIHLQALILAPAVAYLVWAHLKRIGARSIWLWIWVAMMVVLAAATFVYVIGSAGQVLGIATIFLPWFSGRPTTPDYAVVSWVHLRDIANLLLLVYPGLIALLIPLLFSRRDKSSDPAGTFLAWGTIGSLLFLFLVDPSLGMARDWDLMSITLLFPCLYLLGRLSLAEWKPDSRFAAGYTIFCLAMTFLFLASVLENSAAEARALALLRSNQLKDNAGWAILSNYYQARGDLAKAGEITDEMNSFFPEQAKLSEAHLYLGQGEYAKALALAEELYHKDPYRSDYLQVYGTALWKSGRAREAVDVYQSAIALRPFYPHLKNDLGQIYIQLGQLEDAIKILKEARAQDPALTSVAESMALAYITRKNYDSAMAIADTLKKETGDAAGSHLIQMVIAINTGNVAYAKDEFAKYLATGQTRSDYERIKEHYAWVARDTTH